MKGPTYDELTNDPTLEVIGTRLDHPITYDANTCTATPMGGQITRFRPVTHNSQSARDRHVEERIV